MEAFEEVEKSLAKVRRLSFYQHICKYGTLYDFWKHDDLDAFKGKFRFIQGIKAEEVIMADTLVKRLGFLSMLDFDTAVPKERLETEPLQGMLAQLVQTHVWEGYVPKKKYAALSHILHDIFSVTIAAKPIGKQRVNGKVIRQYNLQLCPNSEWFVPLLPLLPDHPTAVTRYNLQIQQISPQVPGRVRSPETIVGGVYPRKRKLLEE